jgi:hypothetical protein
LGVPIAPETHEHRKKRAQVARFSAWANTCHAILALRLRYLTTRAELAKSVLPQFPDCEPAWDALADFYHNQASLLGALDILTFEKLSSWLEQPMIREHLAFALNEARARLGVTDAD